MDDAFRLSASVETSLRLTMSERGFYAAMIRKVEQGDRRASRKQLNRVAEVEQKMDAFCSKASEQKHKKKRG